MTVVSLPLQGRIAKKKDFSPDDYESIVNELLTPADVIYTFVFRYARVIDRDMHTRFGKKVNTHGAPLDFTNSHPWAAWLTTAFVVCAAAAWAVTEHISIKEKAKKEAKEIDESYKAIQEKLFRRDQEKIRREEKALDNKQYEEKCRKLKEQQQASVDELNHYLKQILTENPELRKKYNSVTVNVDQDLPKLLFDKKEPKQTKFQKFVNGYLGPVWSALGITVFVYWIAYAASGVFGDFGNFGASSLPGFGFGISLLAGAAYLGIHGYQSYKQYKQSKSGEISLAERDDAKNGIYLLQECEKRREYDLAKKSLETTFEINSLAPPKISYDKLILPTPEPEVRKGLLATTALTSFVGAYITMQYIAWLAVDLAFKTASVVLPAISLVNFIGGIGLFLVGGIYSIYKTNQAYEKGKPKAVEATAPQQTAEQIFNLKKDVISRLQSGLINRSYNGRLIDKEMLKVACPHEIKVVPKFVPAPKNVYWDMTKRIGKAVFKFACNFMTGAMLARCFMIKGSAIFLPFAALALSNPWTLGLVISGAVGWGLVQIYKEYQQCKAEEEQQAKLEAQQKNAEYIHAIQMADLQITALKELNQKVNSQEQVKKVEGEEKEVTRKPNSLRIVAEKSNEAQKAYETGMFSPVYETGMFSPVKDEPISPFSSSTYDTDRKSHVGDTEKTPLLTAAC